MKDFTGFRFAPLDSPAIRRLEAMNWLIKGVLPSRGLAMVYGPSTSGKSFLAIDMAAAIAEERDWFGYRTRHTNVLYITLEGQSGLRGRVMAWEQANGRAIPFYALLGPLTLDSDDDVNDLARTARHLGHGTLIILDPLNRAAPELDENTSAEMGRIIEQCKRLERLTEGPVLIVHHTGKNEGLGPRGHSSMFAALDSSIKVTRNKEERSWIVDKTKDGRDGVAHQFLLGIVSLGEDEDGDQITSCIITADTVRPQRPPGKTQKIILDAIAAHASNMPINEAIDIAMKHLSSDPKHLSSHAKQTINSLIARGYLSLGNDTLYVAPSTLGT